MTRFYVYALIAFGGIVSSDAIAAPPSLATVYDFHGGADGSGPAASLVSDKAGNLYGITSDGGISSKEYPAGNGTVFELTPPSAGQTQWVKTILYTFAGAFTTDGGIPRGALITDKAGTLYGTTEFGGATSGPCGTVFSLTPPSSGQKSWQHTILYAFPSAGAQTGNGCNPFGRLTLDKKGNLYGTTYEGSPSNGGIVFELTKPTTIGTSWTEQIITYGVGPYIQNPQTGVVLDDAGNLFGTADFARTGYQMVYELSPPAHKNLPWVDSTPFYFNGSNGVGTRTSGELYRDTNGTLYGTTLNGGLGGAQAGFTGTVWSLSPPTPGQTAWTQKILHSFTLGNTGAYPMAGLVADKFGKLYGTTAGYSTGTYPARGASVFSLVPPAPGDTVWDWKKVATFDGTNGAFPMSGVIIAPNGKIYGTTTKGGAYGYGTVFEVTR